mgnify:CR=1 FL=1
MLTPDPFPLDECQERLLSVTCEYLDRLLEDIEKVLDGPPEGSAFPRTFPDIPEDRRLLIRQAIPPIRNRLVQVLDDLGVRRDHKAIPASRAIRANLAMIDITLEELKRNEWGSPGSPAADGEEMKKIIDGLREMISALGTRVDAAMDSDGPMPGGKR